MFKKKKACLDKQLTHNHPRSKTARAWHFGQPDSYTSEGCEATLNTFSAFARQLASISTPRASVR